MIQKFLVLILLNFSFLNFIFSQNIENKSDSNFFFYKNYNYGSMALYNPVSLMLNRGYDIFQMRGEARSITEFNYRANTKKLFYDLGHPISAIESYGYKKFLSHEIFPLIFDAEEARWLPNYTLHLIGGGMTYVSVNEWFTFHNVKYPKLWAVLSTMSYAFMNETLENNSIKGRNTDAIADIYFFDLGGIILFSFKSFNQFFVKQVEWADWSGIASFIIPSATLHNNGQHFAIKYQRPFMKSWKLFAHIGLNGLGGLSYQLNSEHAISAGIGFRSANFTVASDSSMLSTVKIVGSCGVFWDRNNSLMASLVVSNSNEYFVELNIYPQVIKIRNFSPALWCVASKDGQIMLGIAAKKTLGVGLGFKSLTFLK